jgi:hypothetical protein
MIQRFSLYMLIVVAVVELGMTTMGALGFLMEKKMAAIRSTVKRKSISDAVADVAEATEAAETA